MTLNRSHRYLFAFFLLFTVHCGSQQPENYQLQADLWGDKFETQRLRIPSFDGTELAAILFNPKERDFPGDRPAIIFVNSWSLTEDEYDVQARKFAAKGYIVLSYATRGFSSSEGLVSVAGPNDLGDVSAMIDWLDAHTRLDVSKIGMAGVSYGAGISLMALAHDARIKTAVAMSGWGNLEQSLYGRDTIREVWLNLLLISGKILGRLDPEIDTQVKRLKANTDVDAVRSWATARSPLTYIDKINARGAPVFVANSYQDALFPPLQMREFYEKLQGPKAFYLDKGVHASSAIPGLFGLPSPIWTETQRWFDYWLKGIDNGVSEQSPISFQTERGREYFDQFPTLVNKQTSTTLKAVNELSDSNVDTNELSATKILAFTGNIDSGATSGIPLLSDTADATLNVPVVKQLSQIDRRYAAIYTTEPLPRSTRLRGAPQIKIWLAPHTGPIQMVVYLYDRDAWGRGTLITHGVVSRRASDTSPMELSLDLNITGYDVAAGHRLVVVTDTRDPLYTNPASDRYGVKLIQDSVRITEMSLPQIP